MAKMATSLVETGEDAFRKIFKLYKSKNPPPDFGEVIDFSKCVTNEKIVPVKLNPAVVSDEDAAKVGLHPVKDWRAFNLKGYPGFIFITNPFIRGSQPFWIRQCLKIYPQKPNVCNLDMHMSTSDTQDIWAKSVPNLSYPSVRKREPRTLLERLRWVTLGYHYNWNSKTYSSNHYTQFPAELQLLSCQVATACGFPGFNAEAGILNYYRSDSSLGIHVDESELDHSRPLLSFSFGQSAIFLLGGTQRQDAPIPMYMHSGDLMVMSGQSRLLYHAVPRIVQAHQDVAALGIDHWSWQGSAGVEQVSEKDWAVCSKYIGSSRINITVRQVFGQGHSSPETPHLPGHKKEDQTEGKPLKRRCISDPLPTKVFI